MKGCRHNRFLISRKNDNDLTPFENNDLMNHLSKCSSCKDYSAKITGLTKILELKTEKEYNRYDLNQRKTVKSPAFRKIFIAVSCSLVIFISSGLIYKLAVNNQQISENHSRMDEPLGYITFIEEDSGIFFDSDISSQPMNTYFSYLGYEELSR
jgi:predicted anti-sigma-YlaC factor YlaD